MRAGRTTIRIISFILLLALLLAGIIALWPVITPFFLALLLAYLLRPAVESLRRLDVAPSAAILIVYLSFALLMVFIASLCLPLLLEQFRNLLTYLPRLLVYLRQQLSQSLAFLEQSALPGCIDQVLDSAGQALSQRLTAYLGDTPARLSQLIRLLLYGALTPFLGFYLLRDSASLSRLLLGWLPVGERREFLRLAGDVDHLLRQFVFGYLLVSVVIAVLSALFYWAVGLENALALGLIMGVADLIPYFGPYLGAVPAIVLALPAGAGQTLLVAVGLLILQQLEGAVIAPKVMGDKVGLHPLATIFAVLAGGWLFGLIGTILAVPVAAAALLLTRYLWSRLVGVKIY